MNPTETLGRLLYGKKKTTRVSAAAMEVVRSISVANLDSREAWSGLSDRQKLYAYHFSQACWAGQAIVAEQTSAVSPQLLDFIRSFPWNQEPDLRKMEGWDAFVDFACFVVGNLGNYSCIGYKAHAPSRSVAPRRAPLRPARAMAPHRAPVHHARHACQARQARQACR